MWIFMSAKAISCPENSMSQSSPFSGILSFLSLCSKSLISSRADIQLVMIAKWSLSFSTLCSLCRNSFPTHKEASWLRLRAILIYKNKHKYFEGTFMHTFNKISVVSSLFEPMNFLAMGFLIMFTMWSMNFFLWGEMPQIQQ